MTRGLNADWNFHCCYCSLRRIYLIYIILILIECNAEVCSLQDTNAAVYIVTLKSTPAAHCIDDVELGRTCLHHTASGRRNISRPDWSYSAYLVKHQDALLKKVLKGESYMKLYNYNYLLNGFAVLLTPQQAEKLSRRPEVADLVLDFSIRTATTHTPDFLGLTSGAWTQEGGPNKAGEGIVIGFIDTGIDPTHPSFSDHISDISYTIPAHFSGSCEVTKDFPSGSCNRKLIGACHFASSAISQGIFNSSEDYDSPLDADGHGTHTASIAAGNHGISVIVAGHYFGNSSGMAPRAHIAVYKALYKSFGGYAADIVAAIDRAAENGVDIICLSVTSNHKPSGVASFMNPVDMALLSATRAGIFVVQAAGNSGPVPTSILSFSPWIFTIGAASHDRAYNNTLILGNNNTIRGVGLAAGSGPELHTLISATHASKDDMRNVDDKEECQDSNLLDYNLVRGKLLMCIYTVQYVIGPATIKQALKTARNLSATGVIFYMDPFFSGFQLNPTPMDFPGLIVPSVDDSKILIQYYNSSLVWNESSKSITDFGGVARILGGLEATYSTVAPQVMHYSARGPVPEDNYNVYADLMKPNLIAPGHLIWAAWSSHAKDSIEFVGENFAMLSGTSMATAHVAGLAALIKQTFPKLSPAAIASALSTTASVCDSKGGPILAQRAYSNPELSQTPASPFDMGSGLVNVTAALDPGLIFDSSFYDYLSFVCGIKGSGAIIQYYTRLSCSNVNVTNEADLNLPSITIAMLRGSRTVRRKVHNIADNELYEVQWSTPNGVSLSVIPVQFYIGTGQNYTLCVVFNAIKNSSRASFGTIRLFGRMGHRAVIPFTIIQQVTI